MINIQTEWRKLPDYEQIIAHQKRSSDGYGYGRWLCEATGEVHQLNAMCDAIWIDDGQGDFWRITNECMEKEMNSRWVPVGKNGLPEQWP